MSYTALIEKEKPYFVYMCNLIFHLNTFVSCSENSKKKTVSKLKNINDNNIRIVYLLLHFREICKINITRQRLDFQTNAQTTNIN